MKRANLWFWVNIVSAGINGLLGHPLNVLMAGLNTVMAFVLFLYMDG